MNYNFNYDLMISLGLTELYVPLGMCCTTDAEC
jgi:hypothetical protein